MAKTSERPAKTEVGAGASCTIAVDGDRGVRGTVCQAISDFEASDEGVAVAEPRIAAGAAVVAVRLVNWGGGMWHSLRFTGVVVEADLSPRRVEGAVGAVPSGRGDARTGSGGAVDFGVGSPWPAAMLPRWPRLDLSKVRGGRSCVVAPPFFLVGRPFPIVRSRVIGPGRRFSYANT